MHAWQNLTFLFLTFFLFFDLLLALECRAQQGSRPAQQLPFQGWFIAAGSLPT
ncbi:hypothetical protein HYPBUDRAFT_151321 [Hyphopichia burtonii NRRL Y-1933]|uniref:Uncharacterized protein n=1 Tax=Hyphopichia burtonii NRRL Y-1933 TaxID=984485 RepID=A0A1E4RQS8_9ASCO|nr:hypothetical protein HYPBUDRAFT_151321 [Hyphopichia burtonii NRRL Y-1933]ODV69633.1 hypothetical protein HYPBUDRAFT_151321 [Hyphopichia burtonii NRRL Y-1933]